MDSVGERLLAQLRRVAPVKVRVYDAQDESRDVAVPTRRKRWSQVVLTVEARPWVRVELLDKAGAILGYVENDGAAEEIEDIGAPAGGGGRSIEARWMLELMLKAQRTALEFRDKEHSALLASMTAMLDVNAQNMRETVGIMRQQRDEAMELARIRAAAEAGGDLDQIIKLVEASPQLMQAIGPLLGLLLKPKRIEAKATPAPASKAGAK